LVTRDVCGVRCGGWLVVVVVEAGGCLGGGDGGCSYCEGAIRGLMER